ncbi:MAG TPA: chitobiase/beta-hexosaminidase C-terminal domain-containing protein, partial [Candidatus Wallbacteria bacterium]|nr:chitobiase/beta-hexosaminidase C-terminal domain-containing protein [Candidatus Wallbacteria bacterium]
MRFFNACAKPPHLFIPLIIFIAFLTAIYGCGGGGGGGSIINNPSGGDVSVNSNTTLTGYLYDNMTAPSLNGTSAASPSRAAVSGRSIAMVLNLKEYTGVTDGDGFWKMDVEASSSTSVAIIKVKNAKTNLYDSTEIAFELGKTHMIKLFVEADSKLKVFSKQLGEFVANQSVETIKSEVTQKFEEIRASGSNVPVISGLVVSEVSGAPSLGNVSRATSTTEKPSAAIPGVKITLSGNNQSLVTNTDQYGAFVFNGIFISGTYTLKAEKTGYPDQVKTITILSDNYGFACSGILFKMNIPVSTNTPPAITILSTVNNSSEVTINYNLADAEGDSCSVKVYYTTDSGVTYTAVTSVTGDTTAVAVGNNRSLKWLASRNIASVQNSVRVKLIANDGKTDGTAAETPTFSITPKVSAPAFTPAGGSYSSTQNVTISTSTPNATIKYTTDGSAPSSTAGLNYAGQLTIATATTIRAIALKTGFIDSEISEAAYAFDLTLASLASWDFNLQTGQMTLNFNKTMKPSTINITQIKLLNAKSGSTTYSLTNSSASTSDNASFTITLSATDLNAIKGASGLAKNQDTSYLGLGAAAVKDASGNYAN